MRSQSASAGAWPCISQARPDGVCTRCARTASFRRPNRCMFKNSLSHINRRLAAVCLCELVAGRGVVNVFGVRRAYRRQGLELALLRHAFGAFYGRGVREVSLSVDADSTTGAPQLYAHAGMRPVKSFVRYEKELRPGAARAE